MQIIKYTTEEEAQAIITEKTAQGLTLVEVANITEGNFLGFSENLQPTMGEILEGQQTIKDGMADMFMAIASIPGVVL